MPSRTRLWFVSLALIDPLAVLILVAAVTLVFNVLPFANCPIGVTVLCTVVGLVAILAIPAAIFRVCYVYRRSLAKALLAPLHVEGHALLADMGAGGVVTPEQHALARSWIAKVEAVLDDHLDESSAHRFGTLSLQAGLPSIGNMGPGELHSRLINLADILGELSR